jgi:DNA-binding Xre family transcriptional regulator
MTPEEKVCARCAARNRLNELATDTGLSTREIARRLEISPRDLRRMRSGTLPVPAIALLAVESLAQESQRVSARRKGQT